MKEEKIMEKQFVLLRRKDRKLVSPAKYIDINEVVSYRLGVSRGEFKYCELDKDIMEN